MSENHFPDPKEQESIAFEDIKRLTELVFIPAGYIVQLKNIDNDILWEDSKTIILRGDKTGHKCYRVNFGRDVPCPHCTAYDSIQTKTPQIKEDRSVIDGKWYRVVAIPVFYDQKIAAIELIQDITNEKLKSQLYDSVVSKDSVILNIIRHDIPSYLHTVNIALEGILTSETQIDNNKHLLEIAHANTNRAVQILNDLRELSKLEHPLDNLGPINVMKVLKHIQKDITSIYQEKEIKFSILSKIQLEQSTIIANELISEIFLNIFTNAIKFTVEPLIKIDIKIDQLIKDQEFIEIQITDFGQGIPPEIKEFLFDRNDLLKSGWRPTNESTGLGMTIIKSLVDFFGGSISYQNRIKEDWTKGTTVTLLFPQAIQNNGN